MKAGIRIMAVGGLKEDCLLKASDFYVRRLNSLYDLSVVELPGEPAPDHLSAAGRRAVLDREGGRVISRFMPLHIKAALAIEGKLADRYFFRDLIDKAAIENRCVDFIIGGSLGLSESVLRQSDYKISLSRLTFPHRLSRLLLMEILTMAYNE